MELVGDGPLALNLHGNARYILDWFGANSERLERFVPDTPSVGARRKRALAADVLEEAVLRDEVEADREIARRPISSDRVGVFRSDVIEGAIRAGSVERVFEQAGTFFHLEPGADAMPEERFSRQLERKVLFIDPADGGLTYYEPVGGEGWGRGLSRDAVLLLCEEMEGATRMTASLDNMSAVFRAIDAAIEDLGFPDKIGVVLAGDSEDVQGNMRGMEADEYEPYWLRGNADPSVDVGHYHGYPILRGPTNGECRMYVVDLGTWGNFIRAPFEDGREIRVDVEPISYERARELLEANPGLFADQPDDETKLRRIQTCVDVAVGIRHGFRIFDPTRARRIVDGQPLVERDS